MSKEPNNSNITIKEVFVRLLIGLVIGGGIVVLMFLLCLGKI
jgi:hypothetical protein